MRYLIVLALIFLAGCGGGGGSSAPDNSLAGSSLVGKWRGTYTAAGESGTLFFTVGSDNRVVGGLHSDTLGRNAVVVGTLSNRYQIDAAYVWTAGGSPYTSEMFAALGANGHMTGAWLQFFTVTIGGNSETRSGPTLNVDLVRQ